MVNNMADLYRKNIGKLGEKVAANYLKNHKYKILQLNYSTKVGEIDIICENKEYIVFVEVKTRIKDSLVDGVYSVNKKKQYHIIRTASNYISEYSCEKQPRFDIIEVEYDKSINKAYVTEHYKDAFAQGGDYAVF